MNDVSVVIPCYNAGPLLKETVMSALRQTVKPIEILVVDDGSTDGCVEGIRTLDPSVRVIDSNNNGSSSARNLGIAYATGEWVALLDHDDLWEPTKTRRQLEAAKSRPDIICVYCDFFRFRGATRFETVSQPVPASSMYPIDMLAQCTVLPSTALIRRRFASKVAFPDKYGPYAEDAIYFLELRRFGEFHKIAEPLVGYRLSDRQQSSDLWYFYHSVIARLTWLEDNRQHYSNAELGEVRQRFANRISQIHDLAFWDRNNGLVRKCRELFRQLDCGISVEPPMFRRRLVPKWLGRAKDYIDRMTRRKHVKETLDA